jgi:hypothetical protein
MSQEFQIKATIIDIEAKLDKNTNPFYKIALQGTPDYFYAFSNRLPEKTLTTLKESPHQLVNQLALISFEELTNKDNSGTFRRIKAIELV